MTWWLPSWLSNPGRDRTKPLPQTHVAPAAVKIVFSYHQTMPSSAVFSGTLPGPIIVDVQGTALDDHERERLRHPLVGGVILFARNFSDRQQLTALCAAIHECREGPLLIAVDHEGGRVQRFRTDGFTAIPAMRALGQLWDHDRHRALRLATDAGYVMAAELRACGVDFSFTPVLDLDYGISTVIGTRAFHRDPAIVTDLARALILGLARAGMSACGKHFPGHGAVAADSHTDIPVDNRQRGTIMADDAAVYRWLGDLVLPAVMPAHVIYPEVDDRPAGFSSVWIQDILRAELGYDGLVFSDDLTMEGATVAGDIVGRARAALQAGCDMVLVCNRPDMADALLARLERRACPDLARRLRRLLPAAAAPDWAALQAQSQYQHARERLRAAELSG